MLRHLILLAGIAGLFFVCHSREWTTSVAAQAAFEVSFIAGSRDDAGRLMGGTEMRVLTAHAGKLFAGNGYWEDRPGPEGLQGGVRQLCEFFRVVLAFSRGNKPPVILRTAKIERGFCESSTVGAVCRNKGSHKPSRAVRSTRTAAITP